jgi:hypothetical protein
MTEVSEGGGGVQGELTELRTRGEISLLHSGVFTREREETDVLENGPSKAGDLEALEGREEEEGRP